ncbi:MAG: peptidase domain-containing ABC transporter [Firmicutes bacterium]|nr:peptidase domain-containing ABC transporter [Bacillota bacterium]
MKLINQEGIKDCGPTCLLMIIKHYKGNISIEKLKEMCKTSKKGTTAYHLIEAAKNCGFEANGYKCKLKDLNEENIILPCIAYVLLNNTYQHYVVIDKINFKKKKIYIKDPIGKNYIKTFEEFEKIYKDILIYLYPVKNIVNYKNLSCKKFIYNIISPSIPQLYHVILLSVFITIFSIIGTFYMQIMIDNIDTTKSKIYFLFIIFLLMYIFKITSSYLRNKLVILVNKKVDLNLSLSCFNNIISLPYYHYKNNTTGEIVSKINDLNNVKDLISNIAVTLFIDTPLICVSLFIIYILNVNLFILILFVLVLYVLLYLLFNKISNKYIFDCMELKASVTSYMIESINSYEYIKGCNKENNIINKFQKKYIKFLNKFSKYEEIYNIEIILKTIIDEISFLVLILFGIILIVDGKLTLITLITINFLFDFCTNPMKNIIQLNKTLKQSILSIKKIINLYEDKKLIGILYSDMKGDIVFNKLSYSFNDNNKVLKNINTVIPFGNKVMVIGKSGSGKSTMFKLLKKYYDVKRDSIYINNIDINDYVKSDVLYVSQNEFIFTDTIYNNIDSDNILKISKICFIDEIIKNNPLGYNMLIEENGFNISGGEKQRITLARALANRFNILIIDEGLSQVDIKMERDILKNLFDEYKDKTIIFISHRLDNIDLFDQVIKMEDGVIIND